MSWSERLVALLVLLALLSVRCYLLLPKLHASDLAEKEPGLIPGK